MPDVTLACHIAAPVSTVWDVLADFGDIQRWSPNVVRPCLTSEGPVGVGTTRHCNFAVGGAEERIVTFDPGRRLTVALIEVAPLPRRRLRPTSTSRLPARPQL